MSITKENLKTVIKQNIDDKLKQQWKDTDNESKLR